ncbi:MAG: hypothetical protein IV104_11015 [Acidovorax sp.]|nr:hypothetical protein [Acidovorax sp.]
MRAPTPSPYLSSSPLRAVCLVLLTPLLSLAQGTAPTAASPLAPAADAAHAAAPTAPLVHPALAPQPPLPGAAASPQAWHEAHEAVAAFPRGHADILAWEARQRTPTAHQHHHAPGSKP